MSKTTLESISVEKGILNKAQGSVKVTQGETSIIVAIYGPSEVKPKHELYDKAQIEVVFQPRKGITQEKEKLYEDFIQKSLETIICSSQYPRSSITIIIQVVSEGGSILTIVLNACIYALIDAGISLNNLLIGVTMGMNQKRQLLIDPTQKEEELCVSFAYFFFSKSESLISCKTEGILSDDEFFLCQKNAKKAIVPRLDTMTKFLKKDV